MKKNKVRTRVIGMSRIMQAHSALTVLRMENERLRKELRAAESRTRSAIASAENRRRTITTLLKIASKSEKAAELIAPHLEIREMVPSMCSPHREYHVNLGELGLHFVAAFDPTLGRNTRPEDSAKRIAREFLQRGSEIADESDRLASRRDEWEMY